MNTKKRNIGARLGAMLLSLCLMMGLLPTTAFAQDHGAWRASAPRISPITPL